MPMPILHALALTAAFHRVVLDSGAIVLRIPSGARIVKRRVDFETDEYVVQRSGREILDIVAGGGSEDLHAYKRFCLNHRRALRSVSKHGMRVIIGDSGVNAVRASYDRLSAEDEALAKNILASIDVRSGAPCRL